MSQKLVEMFLTIVGSETKNILCYEKSCHILQLQGTWNVENAQKYTRHVKVKLSTETFAQNCLIWHVEKPFTICLVKINFDSAPIINAI